MRSMRFARCRVRVSQPLVWIACTALSLAATGPPLKGSDPQPASATAIEKSATETTAAAATEATAAPADASQPAYTLRYRFEPNQAIYFNVVHKSAILTQMRDAKDDVMQETTTDKHFRVISVDDKNIALVESSIDRVQTWLKFNTEKPVAWDSQSQQQPPRALMGAANNIGKPLAMMKFAPDGKLVELVPLAAAKANAQFKGEQGGGDDASRNFLIIFPSQPIRVGESWNDDFEVRASVPGGVPQPIKLRRQYTLKSVAGDLATIELVTKVLTAVNNPKIGVQLIQRTPTGTIIFDMKKGIIVSRAHKTSERVFGFAGEGSSISAADTLEEKLVERPATAAKSK